MRKFFVCVGLIGLVGCAKKELVLPDVQPVPSDDLAAYQSPVMINPPLTPVLPSLPMVQPPGPHELRYEWIEGKEDLVQVQVNFPIVLKFPPSEKLVQIVDADRNYVTEEEAKEPPQREKQPNCSSGIRFQFCKGTASQALEPIDHLIITATHVGQQTGIVVLTDHRTYMLKLLAVQRAKTRLVTWTVPPPPPAPPTPKAPGVFPESLERRTYHVGYTYTDKAGNPLAPGQGPDWMPQQTWSDVPGVPAAKIYLAFPLTVLHQRMPLLRGMDEQGQPYLLNSRQVGRFVIVDELAPRLELRRGAKDDAHVVVITREQLRPIHCPGEAECPVFP